MDRIIDYGKDRYGTRDEAVLDRKLIIKAPYKQFMKWIADKNVRNRTCRQEYDRENPNYPYCL